MIVDNRNNKELEQQHNYTLKVLPLYASLTLHDQKSVFAEFTKGDSYVRKCVVCTNIAETSITVPGVKFVIDCGYVKQKTYDPVRHMESLLVVPISKVYLVLSIFMFVCLCVWCGRFHLNKGQAVLEEPDLVNVIDCIRPIAMRI